MSTNDYWLLALGIFLLGILLYVVVTTIVNAIQDKIGAHAHKAYLQGYAHATAKYAPPF
jgi:type II secretory pathway pseudopilin PulG